MTTDKADFVASVRGTGKGFSLTMNKEDIEDILATLDMGISEGVDYGMVLDFRELLRTLIR